MKLVKRCAAAFTVAALMFVTSTAFGDTGVFIKNAVLVNKDGECVTSFSQGSRVYISEENESQYIINEDDDIYHGDKQDLLIVTKKTRIFRVKNEAAVMYLEPNINSNPLKELMPNQILYPESLEDQFGLFRTEDNKKGYVLLSSIEEGFIEKENISQATATATLTVKNSENKYLHIKKLDILYIKDFKDNQYIVLDEEGNEFLVNPLLVSLNSENVQASRSTFNRKSTTNVSKVIEYAYNSIGKPYVYGDTGKKGYDCSGLVYSIFLQIGVELPRSSSSQASSGVLVKKEDLIAGDLIFFNTNGKGVSHVGLYIGDGKMIHASTSSKKVKIDEINSSYYGKRYVTARRIIGN
ncbi:C40 family peptidase [Proteiniborus sp. MB09-C3]|uniref:C40 family peptidase n=1 Tax=Proteiniborus sp. MB09-C3 TaxID=3050072 RepID=UPI002552D80B|nr:C40 family peptidase [Proteiniborus sp. MB09-C3]WIV10714.1 C40 family peptidase [Proteiniborus sp. MB09-C3]